MTELEKCEIIQKELERVEGATSQAPLEYRNSLRRYLLLMVRPSTTPPPEPLTQDQVAVAMAKASAKDMERTDLAIDKARQDNSLPLVNTIPKPIPNTDRLAKALDKLIPKEEDSAPGTHIPNL